MSDIDPLGGMGFAGLLFFAVLWSPLWLWPVTLGLLAEIGIVGIRRRNKTSGKVFIVIAIIGTLGLALIPAGVLGPETFNLMFLIAILPWPVPLGMLACLGIVGVWKRGKTFGKVFIGVAVIGTLVLMVFLGRQAYADHLEKQRVEKEHRQLFAGVERGDIQAAEKCLFSCPAAERELKVDQQHAPQAAQLILAAHTDLAAQNSKTLVLIMVAHKVIADEICTTRPQQCMPHLLAALEVAKTSTFWNYLNDRSLNSDFPFDHYEIERQFEEVVVEILTRKQENTEKANAEHVIFNCHPELWDAWQLLPAYRWVEICEKAENNWRTTNQHPKQAESSH